MYNFFLLYFVTKSISNKKKYFKFWLSSLYYFFLKRLRFLNYRYDSTLLRNNAHNKYTRNIIMLIFQTKFQIQMNF